MRRQRAEKTQKDQWDFPRSDSAIDEKIGRLFEPDVLATEEYRLAYHRRTLSSEQLLMAAVLEQGITDYRRCVFARDKKGKKLFLDAVAWISFDDYNWVFSFANCCTALGIDPGYLRHRLVRWLQSRSTTKIFPKAA
jgi:hypothetical protein